MTLPGSRRQFVQSLFSTPLISRGQRPRSIFLAPEASPSERWAAAQLQAHLERMTGARLEITDGGHPAIALGQSAVTERLGLQVPDGESCLLKTAGDVVIIAGGRTRGTMYGVFVFLERLGCRWYTTDIARIPAQRGLAFPRLDEIIRPAFQYREVFFTEAQGKEWSARNRLNGHFHQLDEETGGKVSYFPFAHSFYDLIPPDRWFADHPEYFAFVAGKRRRENAQLCMTNEEVVRIATERVGEWIAAHPEVSIFSVSQNDGGGWCECEPCRQVIRAEGGAVSGLLLRFVNRIAEPFAHSHPRIRIDTLAYQGTIDPPASARPLPNVQIRFCPIDACQAHSYETCVYNRRTYARLAQWSHVAPGLRLWQYSINFSHYLLPFPNEHELISDIPRFRRAGVSGIFLEGAGSGGNGSEDAELRAYIGARLMWDTGIDIRAEIRGFLDAVYGPAARSMAAYFALRHREADRGEHLWVDQNVDGRYLTNGFLKDARTTLQSALAKASTDSSHRRIERHLLSLDYIGVMRARRCELRGASLAPGDPERTAQDTKQFITRATALNITQLREGYPIAEHAQNLDRLGGTWSAISLHHGTATAAIVPDLGARVISFARSAGERNLLRVPDPGEFAYPYTGGLWLSIASNYLSNPQRVEWRAGTATEDALTIMGRSEQGLDIQLDIQLNDGTLRMRAEALNAHASPVDAVLRLQAEFPIGPAERPDGGRGLTNEELEPATAVRGNIRWSFRGIPRLDLTLWSQEAALGSGEKLSLSYVLREPVPPK